MPGESKVKVENHTLFAPKRKLRVVCAGAGMSGIIMAYKMYYQYGLTKNGLCELEVYEKNVSTNSPPMYLNPFKFSKSTASIRWLGVFL